MKAERQSNSALWLLRALAWLFATAPVVFHFFSPRGGGSKWQCFVTRLPWPGGGTQSLAHAWHLFIPELHAPPSPKSLVSVSHSLSCLPWWRKMPVNFILAWCIFSIMWITKPGKQTELRELWEDEFLFLMMWYKGVKKNKYLHERTMEFFSN